MNILPWTERFLHAAGKKLTKDVGVCQIAKMVGAWLTYWLFDIIDVIGYRTDIVSVWVITVLIGRYCGSRCPAGIIQLAQTALDDV
jgi:hypothetical protein